MRYSELFSDALARLADSEKNLDIQILIEESFGLSRPQFWAHKEKEIENRAALRKFRRCFSRLLKQEPLAYILGEKDFYSEKFYVNHHVLIPRPETEILVYEALRRIDRPLQVLDVGSGSGNIAIVIAKKTRSSVTATENSKLSMRVFRKNCQLHGLSSKIVLVQTDLFPLSGHMFDMIVSNPPYLSRQDWENLPPHIKHYEPVYALVGGSRGTEIIQKIVSLSPRYLKSNGYLLLEIGYGHAREVSEFLKEASFRQFEFVNDCNNIQRVVIARK